MSERYPSMLRTGAIIVCLAGVAALIGPWLTPFDPAAQTLSLRLAAPSLAHPFGLDELGRDIFARVLAGARISLYVGVTVVSVSALVGTLLGAVAGYYGGLVDDVISRVIDTLLAFPGLLLAIAVVAVLGPSLAHVLMALTAIGWVGYARLVRGQVLRGREFEYVQAARALAPVRRAFFDDTFCRPRFPRLSCRRRWAWLARSSARLPSVFWGSASSHPRQAGGPC